MYWIAFFPILAGQKPTNMKNIFLFYILSLWLTSAFAQKNEGLIDSPVDYVNTLMGTQSKISLSNGNTYPAVTVPWGMNFWTPQTGKMGNGWQYTYDADKIRGFKQTHQPSPWINDFGQFVVMPVTGKLCYNEDDRASWFSHKAEIAKPYYYSVYLADHNITAELTPTERSAIFRFTYPETDSAYIVIDALDKGAYIKVIPEENKIVGYSTKNSGGVAANFKNYFVIYSSKPFSFYKLWNKEGLVDPTELYDEHVGAVVGFKTQRGEQVVLRVASSFISTDQAELNLQREIGNKDFDTVRQEAKTVWNKAMERIKVEGGTDEQLCTFYSCLYRCLFFPHKLYEINAEGKPVHYSPFNGEVSSGYLYTGTGFWDTFRALFPLLNLVYPEVNAEIQEGLLNTYKESGWLPEWASPGHRNCMVGNNSASVVADAFLKGITVSDVNKLYEALLHGANNVNPKIASTGRLGYEYYNTLGYVPYDVKINENAARTLEYAYDDWCMAQMGKKLGRPQEEIELYTQRSQNYRKLFDPETNLMRGRNAGGSFQKPFNPFKWGDAFTEGNAWHYTWSVFHDVQGLIDLMGGKLSFNRMLDTIFSLPPIFDESYYGGVIHEIREMQIMNMGQYAHGNQPIQHMIYLYNYSGEPWKTQYWVREVMNRLYTSTPDGYCGDEDNGQTSAWYVFSAMGFYPVCPGSDQYVLGAPLFKKITLTLTNGKTVCIESPNNNPTNRYIRSMTFNRKPYTKNYMVYSDLLQGATLFLEMHSTPNYKRGIAENEVPYSFSLSIK